MLSNPAALVCGKQVDGRRNRILESPKARQRPPALEIVTSTRAHIRSFCRWQAVDCMYLLVSFASTTESCRRLTTACLVVALTLRRILGLLWRSRDSLECLRAVWCCRIGHALRFRRTFSDQLLRRLATSAVKHSARCCLSLVAGRCYSFLLLASHRRSLLNSSYYD